MIRGQLAWKQIHRGVIVAINANALSRMLSIEADIEAVDENKKVFFLSNAAATRNSMRSDNVYSLFLTFGPSYRSSAISDFSIYDLYSAVCSLLLLVVLLQQQMLMLLAINLVLKTVIILLIQP